MDPLLAKFTNQLLPLASKAKYLQATQEFLGLSPVGHSSLFLDSDSILRNTIQPKSYLNPHFNELCYGGILPCFLQNLLLPNPKHVIM